MLAPPIGGAGMALNGRRPPKPTDGHSSVGKLEVNPVPGPERGPTTRVQPGNPLMEANGQARTSKLVSSGHRAYCQDLLAAAERPLNVMQDR